jgi:NADH-quinone oxidoreductase subunit A
MTPLVAYLLLFITIGAVFILVNLLVGKMIRPNNPDAEKKTIYECGEPTIGSAWIQFDLRFYVIALLFVVFDVEVAFFFPWAEVFGKANNIAAQQQPTTREEYQAYAEKVAGLASPHLALGKNSWSERAKNLGKLTDEEFNLLSAEKKQEFASTKELADNRQAAQSLAWLALGEVGVFFGVLLVGFAYLWRRGDLAWVRSTLAERPATMTTPPTLSTGQPPLVGAGS